MLLGAHMSIEGGLDLAVERARRAGCDVLQVFTKSSNQWKAKSLGADDVARFRARLASDGIGHVSAHDSYLINMASPDEALYRKSVDALCEELRRCEALGIPFLIAHPGAHVGSGLDAGIRRIADALNEALAAVPGPATTLLLETWAGQGTTIGARFEELARILELVKSPGQDRRLLRHLPCLRGGIRYPHRRGLRGDLRGVRPRPRRRPDPRLPSERLEERSGLPRRPA